MGVTIHYQLSSDATGVRQARQLVAQLRQHALVVPFQQVDDVVELMGNECDFQQYDDQYPHRWLLIQARQLVPDTREVEHRYVVVPKHVIAFSCWPGRGCEQANFGLCRYPATIEVGRWMQRTIRTKLGGWFWGSFCKTEYARSAECGGEGNFRRCHMAVLDLLQHAQSLGILHEVYDEAGFWDSRLAAAEALALVSV